MILRSSTPNENQPIAQPVVTSVCPHPYPTFPRRGGRLLSAPPLDGEDTGGVKPTTNTPPIFTKATSLHRSIILTFVIFVSSVVVFFFSKSWVKLFVKDPIELRHCLVVVFDHSLGSGGIKVQSLG